MVAAAVVEDVRSEVTVTSAVAEAVSPELMIEVAVTATRSSAGAAVTVIVTVCAAADWSEPAVELAPIVGVKRTT